MITGIHAILFSKHAESVRGFLADVLELPSVDAGGGWPIFAAPPAELAMTSNETVAELAKRGIKTAGAIEERGWGFVTSLVMPGGEEIGLYEPRHPSPIR